ncbi:Acyl-CoA-binding domain-containing protein 1 [Sesamum alatum]|uniref:Acyl-CoA-binding domain-containing protein 1 n=1 Tax=Sesamum alatum TaxID=300844 RepID=A0AAE1YU85_9LAMI|nr:Acyl-CoA-binding domain-containing protein 1 [Sesamum alatum]
MAEWQQYLQSVFFGVVFSFLLAKLFSVIFAFREENLRMTCSHQTEAEDGSKRQVDEKIASSSGRVLEENEPLLGGNYGAVKKSAVIKDHVDSDDDWEGVESTELDETFSAATAFVAAKAADRAAQKVSSKLQLQFYGLYKIATEGPCSAPQPSVLKMTARAKWQAWQKLGAMPPEEAMQKYIDIVTELYPSWASAIKKNDLESSNAPNAGSKGPMGPVFSTFIHEEEPGCELKLDAIHAFAREGDEEKLLKCIESSVSLNLKDSEGRTPLHWAVDRGHMNVTALLLEMKADVNAKDDEGQTALHYAAVCERAAIAELLVEHGADIMIKDKEGNTPVDVCEWSWPWLQRVSNAAD